MALQQRLERVFDLHGVCATVGGDPAVASLCFQNRARERGPTNEQPRAAVSALRADQVKMVGTTGIEPVTPSMSTKCSPAELIAHP